MIRRSPYSYKYNEKNNVYELTEFPPKAFATIGIPTKMCDLPTEEVTPAVKIGKSSRLVYTGGRGRLNIWDISQEEVSLVNSTTLSDQYLRSIKLASNDRTLIASGEVQEIFIWDSEKNRLQAELITDSVATYGTALSPDERLLFAGHSTGFFSIWDVHNQQKITSIRADSNDVSCIDMDENSVWTGGLDGKVRLWDIRDMREKMCFTMGNEVFTLSCHNDQIVIGLENGNIEILSSKNSEQYSLRLHNSCLLSLKFSSSGDWFISGSKDGILNGWRAPYGANLFKEKEMPAVLSCDISQDDRLIAIGTGENKATVYSIDV